MATEYKSYEQQNGHLNINQYDEDQVETGETNIIHLPTIERPKSLN